MTAFKQRLARVWHAPTVVPFALMFAATVTVVFWEVLSKWTALTSPDDAPFYPVNYLVTQIETWLTGKSAFFPQRFLNLFAPVAAHDLAYMVCLFLLGLSGVYYLRTQRVARPAAWGGGLMLAFSGYTCTLFNAGHLGFFYLISAMFWSFGLVSAAIGGRRSVHFVLLGGTLMWGQPWQADVWMLWAAVFGFYTLWRLMLAWRNGTPFRVMATAILPRFLLTLGVAALLGASGIRNVLTEQLAGRDQQIEQVSRAQDPQAVATETADDRKALERWHFATGWSLPPEDVAELMIPGIFGNDSFRPPHPYWGRLGRYHDFQPGRMMPNYRQHTVYQGLISLVAAFFGMLAWLFRKRALKAQPKQPVPDHPSNHADISDVPFWMGVGLVALLLAMGRFTPVYRLFYSIPFMNYLRAPVKFLHLTGLATALLAGFGLNAMLSDRTSIRLRRGFVQGTAVLAGCLLLAAWLIALNGAAIERYIAGLGMEPYAAALRGYAVFNTLRAAGIAAAATLLFLGMLHRSESPRILRLAVAGLIALGVTDLALVARRYVIPVNVKPFHQPNLVVKEIMTRTGGRPAHLANYATPNAWGQDWFNTSLALNGFLNVMPDPRSPDAVERRYLMAFQNNPMRFWQITGTRFVILPRQQIEPLIVNGIMQALLDFELGPDTVWRTGVGAGPLVLGELRGGGLPRVYFDWIGGVPDHEQVDRALGQTRPVPVTAAPPPPPATSGRAPQTVAFSRSRGERGVLVTRGEWDLEQAGLLVWGERLTPGLVAFVNAAETPVYQVDGLWCGIPVPSGRVTVSIRMRCRPFLNLVAAITSILVLLYGVVWMTAGNRLYGKD